MKQERKLQTHKDITSLDKNNENIECFSVAIGNTVPTFKDESALDDMSKTIKFTIIITSFKPVAFWMNNRFHISFGDMRQDFVCIISPICGEYFCSDIFEQVNSFLQSSYAPSVTINFTGISHSSLMANCTFKLNTILYLTYSDFLCD